MSKNTIVRGMLVPSLKNKPLDGRMDVPTLADIVNIENPYVNFIFPVAETGMWYKVTKLADKVIDELVVPNGEVAEYETFGEGMTDKQKEDYLTKSLAEQLYLKKSDAVLEYMSKTDAEANFLKNVQADLEYLKKSDAKGLYQPTGDYVTSEEADQTYQPKGDYAMQKKVEELEQLITGGGGDGGTGGTFVDAPRDGKTYGRKDGLWEELEDAPNDGLAYARLNGAWAVIESGNALDPMLPVLSLTIGSSIENDATIAKVMAKVAYADKEFTLGNGGKMNVPYGLTVTVTFPNVDNYSTPEEVVFDDVQGDIEASVTYINLQEVVNVYVSADDGSVVDGQVVTVEKLTNITDGETIESINYEVLGGKVSCDVMRGDILRVSINALSVDYSHPNAVVFVVESGGKNVYFEYEKLLISTIYINNKLADSANIVTGERNGIAIQKILSESKRHLGKYIELDDGSKQLVLTPVDENDGTYYPNGVPVGHESLGTSAYYFSKLSSWSYRITNMGNEIYKVEICYKHQPDETWHYFEERWMPITILHYQVAGSLGGYDMTKLPMINNSETAEFGSSGLEEPELPENISFLDLDDVSSIYLLYLARYGVIYKGTEAEEVSVSTTKSGWSLTYGNKDLLTGSILTFLGVEKLIGYCSVVGATFSQGDNTDVRLTAVLRDGSEEIFDNVSRYNGSNSLTIYYKSLQITDKFRLVSYYDSEDGQGTSDTYYRGHFQYSYSSLTPYIYCQIRNGALNIEMQSKVSGIRVQYIGNYKIVDTEAFNEYENTWV